VQQRVSKPAAAVLLGHFQAWEKRSNVNRGSANWLTRTAQNSMQTVSIDSAAIPHTP
jgi:hypothetical protein